MLYIVITFLFLAIVLYFLLGGADFGAGIIELFTSEKNKSRTRKTMYHAIGPIWEANHMWLIIAVVIMFVGFPVIYSDMCTYLHIPLLIMLLGITARGTAFAFRSYDAVKDEKTQNLYNHIFVYSSFITPLFLGIIAGSAISGQIDLNAKTFLSAYIFDWLNYFSVAVGFFTVALSGYLAAIYLVGEADDDNDARRFVRKARIMNILALFFGGMVFLAAELQNMHLARMLFGLSGLFDRCYSCINFIAYTLGDDLQRKKENNPRACCLPGYNDPFSGRLYAFSVCCTAQGRRKSFPAHGSCPGKDNRGFRLGAFYRQFFNTAFFILLVLQLSEEG